MLESVTLQNEFYNIFAYAAVKSYRWTLACRVTVRPSIIKILIARRNDILVELLLQEK